MPSIEELVNSVINALARLFLKPAEEAYAKIVDMLLNYPYLDLEAGWFTSDYAVTAAAGIALSFPLMAYRTIRNLWRNDVSERKLAVGMAEPGGVWLLCMCIPSLYLFGQYAAIKLSELAMQMKESGATFESLYVFDLGDGLSALIIGLFSYAFSWVITAEVIVIQYFGFVALVFLPPLFVLRNFRLAGWLYEKMVAIAFISLFSRPLMLFTMVIGDRIIGEASQKVPVLTAAAILGVIFQFLTAAAPFFIRSGYNRKVEAYITGGSLSGAFTGTSQAGSVSGGAQQVPSRSRTSTLSQVAAGAGGLLIEHKLDKLALAEKDHVGPDGNPAPRRGVDSARVIASTALTSKAGAMAATGAGPVGVAAVTAAGVLTAPKGKSKEGQPTTATGTLPLPAGSPLPPPSPGRSSGPKPSTPSPFGAPPSGQPLRPPQPPTPRSASSPTTKPKGDPR